MNTKGVAITGAVIGLALTIFGYMTSDAVKYPVASRFSAWVQIAGVAILALSIVALYPKVNPITAIAS